jgi:hypothetical protein
VASAVKGIVPWLCGLCGLRVEDRIGRVFNTEDTEHAEIGVFTTKAQRHKGRRRNPTLTSVPIREIRGQNPAI